MAEGFGRDAGSIRDDEDRALNHWIAVLRLVAQIIHQKNSPKEGCVGCTMQCTIGWQLQAAGIWRLEPVADLLKPCFKSFIKVPRGQFGQCIAGLSPFVAQSTRILTKLAFYHCKRVASCHMSYRLINSV